MERELKTNPEFFKAFPHLQSVFEDATNEEGDQKRYLDKKIVNFSGLTDNPQYFEGLLHQQNNMQVKETDPEEIIRENERNFIEGSSISVDGPIKYMSKERLDQVHFEIDQRMQELEDTGLTRNEILFNDAGKGIPLRDDPFYQLIKGNKTVREMLIGANEEFSADRVLEKALRQDVGIDSSLSNFKLKHQFHGIEDPTSITWEYKKKYRDTTPVVSAESYYSGGNIVERYDKQLEYEKEKPATFLNRPLTRAQLRKRYMRTISKRDIEWKNTPMMIKFMNEQGKLLNRFQSRLPTSTQRKVAKTIKKMRHLGVLPTSGNIMPTDKIPIGSYIQDIEEMHKKTIDPVTGRMFMKHTLQDDLRDKRLREKAMVDRKAAGTASTKEDRSEEDLEEIRENLVRQMSLDTTFAEYPSSLSREWQIA